MTRNVRRAAIIATSACALLLVACAKKSVPPDLAIDPAATYEGPPIESDVVEGKHALSVIAPNPGWNLVGESIDRRFRDTRLYLTLVRPDPELVHAQALMEYHITPDVPADEPIAVYVRVVDHDDDANETPFRLATTIEPRRARD